MTEAFVGIVMLVALCLLVGGATGGFDDRDD
jgi:hypothetical protein